MSPVDITLQEEWNPNSYTVQSKILATSSISDVETLSPHRNGQTTFRSLVVQLEYPDRDKGSFLESRKHFILPPDPDLCDETNYPKLAYHTRHPIVSKHQTRVETSTSELEACCNDYYHPPEYGSNRKWLKGHASVLGELLKEK